MCIYIYINDVDISLGEILYLIQGGSEFCELFIEIA